MSNLKYDLEIIAKTEELFNLWTENYGLFITSSLDTWQGRSYGCIWNSKLKTYL